MDIFKIVGKIALDGQEDFEKGANNAKKIGADLAKSIGSGLATVGKIGAAALGIASAATVAIGKAGLDAYSQYEQLAGGMKKIFSDMDTTRITADAAQAYKDLGMSANDYLKVINDVGASFSATMGAETGYEVARKGLTAISDYASGTGKSFDELQGKFAMITRSTSSYQSIADQFSGILPATSDGFLKQAQAAGFLSTKYKELSKVPINEYQQAVADMLALGVDGLNLTGNTAAEASETISGSLAMTKAAWSNLLVGFADSEQDLDLLVNNFVESVTTAARQIVPRLTQIFSGISKALPEVMSLIAEELPSLMAELLPGIIAGAGALIQGLIEALPELLTVLWDALGQIVGGIWDYIAVDLLGTDYDFTAALSDLTAAAEVAWTEIQETWNAIGQPIWNIIQSCIESTKKAFSNKMPEISGFVSGCFSDISTWWNDNLQPCLQAIGDFIETYLAPAFEAVFNSVICAAVEGGFQFISDLWNNTLMPVLTGITTFLTGVFTGDWEMAFGGLEQILDGFKAFFVTTWESLVTFFSTLLAPLVDWFSETWSNIQEGLSEKIEGMKQKWEAFKDAISENIEQAVATVTTKFNEIKQQIESKVNDAKDKAKEAFENIKKDIEGAMNEAKKKVSDIWGEIKGVFADAINVGKKIVEDIKQGISDAWQGLKSWFNGLWNGLFGNLTANVTVNKSSSGTDGSHADGLDYVPYDGYIAELHKGEMVVPAVEAMVLRNGVTGTVGNSEIASILMMILEAVHEGNEKETVFTLNNREFGRAVRGVAHA